VIFITVDIFGIKRFFVFFIIELKSRKIVHYNVTQNPNIQLLRSQFSYFEELYPKSYLIHDNSGELKYFPYQGIDSIPEGRPPDITGKIKKKTVLFGLHNHYYRAS
jgi:hypothetical protein